MSNLIDYNSENDSAKSKELERAEIINYVFTLFKKAYNNQYYSAYPDLDNLNSTKRIWFKYLINYSVKTIQQAGLRSIGEFDYLPNLSQFVKICNELEFPDSRQAYYDACQSRSNRANYQWSHDAVYHAGARTGWHLIDTKPEKIGFPIFEKTYKYICRKMLEGYKFHMPDKQDKPRLKEKPLSKEENLKRLEEMRKEWGI